MTTVVAVTSFDLSVIGAGLPAAQLIDTVRIEPAVQLRAVVQAPPGNGKTTVLPPLIANQVPGKVIVATPRRMAARAAAHRLAQLSNTVIGDRVGYSVRGERKLSPDTQVEFLTYGLLLRRLLAGGDLPGVSAVILDEIHERSLDADVVVGIVDAVSRQRDDLHLVLTSATVSAQEWAEKYWAQVYSVDSAIHPVSEHWVPYNKPSLDTRGVTRDFLAHVAEITEDVVASTDGDVLVFVPGVAEINEVAARIPGALKLSGLVDAKDQDQILNPSADGEQRVIISTNISESAVTVPGVRAVVDAGLDRQPRLDTVRAISGLVTVGASKAAMVQRAGRAGREAPGAVYRCMSQAEFAARPADTPPEIRTGSVTEAVLQVACWGDPLSLPDSFPQRSYDLALEVLQRNSALDADGQVTELGRRLVQLPLDIGLGRALLDGVELIDTDLAIHSVATLSSEQREVDALRLHRQVRTSRQYRDELARLGRFLNHTPDTNTKLDAESLGLITALGYPRFIARRRTHDDDEYLTTGGTAVTLPKHGAHSLNAAQWLAISELSIQGERTVIRRAVEITQDIAELAWPVETTLTTEYAQRRVSARRREHLGAITLRSTPIQPDDELKAQAVAQAISTHGLAIAEPSEAFERLRSRLAFAHQHLPDWPDVSGLEEDVNSWAGYALASLADGHRPDLVSALKTWVGWEKMPQLDEMVPETLHIASGHDVQVDYPADGPPMVAAKLQQFFGMGSVQIAGVPIQFQLLSPAGRPLAITQDLNNFWATVYPQVRAENRGRYPKHPWPEDPTTAEATIRTKPR